MAISVSKSLKIGWPAGSRIPPPSRKASSEEPLGSGPLSWGRPPSRCRDAGDLHLGAPGDVNPRPGRRFRASCCRAPRLHWWRLPQPWSRAQVHAPDRGSQTHQSASAGAGSRDTSTAGQCGENGSSRPQAPSSGRGSAKHERPGEGEAGLIVADFSVSESLVLPAVHIGEVPASLQTSHMTGDILCHECCLLSLCEWKCSPFKVGALRMGSASGSAQHS